MENFTRTNVRKLEDEMIAVLNRYGFKNVEFSASGARFSPTECTFKVVGKVEGTVSRAESELAFHAKMDGIDHTSTGAKGETLIEYHSRKRKYPYIYSTISGTRYKCDAISAKRIFGTI